MRIVAVAQLPPGLAEAVRTLAETGWEIEQVADLPEAAPPGAAPGGEILLLVPAGLAPGLLARSAGSADPLPPCAVFGEEAAEGLAALAAGADLWLDPREAPAHLAARIEALGRRALLGGAPRVDSVTGLLGRAWFRDLLRHEFDRAVRYRRALAVLVLEPDGGEDLPPARQEALASEIAGRLRRQVRDVDLLGRLGPRRFALALPETDAGGGLAAAERLRAALADLPLPGPRRGSRTTTVSLGVAAWPARGMERADDLLGRALEALGQARRRGGNVVIPFGAADVIWSRTAPDPWRETDRGVDFLHDR